MAAEVLVTLQIGWRILHLRKKQRQQLDVAMRMQGILKEEGSGYQVRLVRNAPPGSYGAKVGSVTRPDGSKGYGIRLFVTARPSEAEQLIQP